MPTTTPQINFGVGSTVSIDAVDIPEPAPNQLLVKATRSLISAGTEHNMLESQTKAIRVPGYSLVGQVIEVGEAVEGYAAGDRVLTYLKHQGAGLVTIARVRRRCLARGASSWTSDRRFSGGVRTRISGPDGHSVCPNGRRLPCNRGRSP